MQIAEREGYKFVLYVRKDDGTTLSKDLQSLVDTGKIILKEIP